MAIRPPKIREMLVIQAPRGGTHITGLDFASRTVCGRPTKGWAIAPIGDRARTKLADMRRGVSCMDCKAKAFLPVKRRR